MKLALHLFDYLKIFSNRRLVFDSRDINYEHILDDTSKLRLDFQQDYPDAFEEMDKNFLEFLDVHFKLVSAAMLMMCMIT